MPSLLNQPLSILDKKQDRYLLIIVVFVFSVFFVNVFEPWNIRRWFSDSGFIQFLRLSSYGLVIGLVFLFTQFPLRKWTGIQQFTVKTYALWLVIEIALICFMYILIYGNPIGNFMYDLGFALRHTLPGFLIPYTFGILVIHYRNHRKEIKQLQNKISLPQEKKLIAIKDENDKVRFSVQANDILLLESTDNYLTVHFISEGEMQRELIRNTMKKMENQLAETKIMRCHRSFMVNTDNIEMVKNEGKKMKLKVRSFENFIPVSEKYSSLFSSISS